MVSLSGNGVSVIPSDFAVSGMPQSASLSSVQSAIFTLSVTASGGFNQTVTFACSGLPAGASCNFAPASVTPGSSSAATTNLTITTTPRSAAIFRSPLTYLRYRIVELFLLFVCCSAYSFARTRKHIRFELVQCLLRGPLRSWLSVVFAHGVFEYKQHGSGAIPRSGNARRQLLCLGNCLFWQSSPPVGIVAGS